MKMSLLFILNVLIIIIPLLIVISNNNYQSINGIFTYNEKKDKAYTFYGDWEFYYNSLIKTDDVNRDYDAILTMPSSWEGHIINDKKLSKTGYGSYRLIVKNINEKEIIKPVYLATNVSMNIYINDCLVAKSGVVSKDKDKNIVGHKFDYINDYPSIDDYLEIVIEVGYNEVGGLNNLPLFTISNYSSINLYSFIVLSILVLCLFGVLFLVELISVFFVRDSSFHTIIIAILIVGFYLTTNSFNNLLAISGIWNNYKWSGILNILFLVLLLDAFLYFINYTYKIKFPYLIPLIFIESIIMFLSISNNIKINILSYTFLFFLYFFNLIYLTKRIPNFLDGNFYFVLVIISLIFSIYNLEFLHKIYLIKQPPLYSTISLTILIFFCFIAIYILFIARTLKTAYKSSEYLNSLEKTKTILLREQIKPHYIFNNLNAIQSLYHENIENGDKALNLFAKNLRSNLETMDNELIDFSKELDNIANFIELQNIRLKNKVKIIFNIDYFNFKVPPMSIEPFIENSIKYSQIDKKEDGYIEISSLIDESFIIIKIIDNGVGFDTNAIKNTSHGINNSSMRFKILLHATTIVESQLNIGTTIIIKIPFKERIDI